MNRQIGKRTPMNSISIELALKLPERNRAERARKTAIMQRAIKSRYLRKHGWSQVAHEPEPLAAGTSEAIK